MRIVRENMGLALIALIIALLVKSYVWLIDPPTRIDLTIPVQARNLPSKLSVSSIVPARIDMSISGSKSKVEKYSEREFTAIADCSQITSEGHFEVKVRISQSRLSQVEYSLSPDSVHLIIGLFEKKFFDPTAKHTGELRASRIISKIEGLPETIQVSGSAKTLERVSKVVYTLNLDRPGDVWTDEITFLAVDSDGAPIDNLQLNPSTASITVYLREHKVKQTLPVVLRVRGTPARDYAITSQSVTPQQVDVIGEPAIIGSLTYIDTSTISVSDARSDITTELDLVAPDPAIVLQPSKVKVTIVIDQVLSRRDIESIPIELKRQKNGYTYKISPSHINVRIQGPVEKLKNLDLTLIRPSIDVSIYEEGTYNVILERPGLPSEVSLLNMIPEAVELTVARTDSNSND